MEFSTALYTPKFTYPESTVRSSLKNTWIMPASGPVYQPTTVSYEQQEWSRPHGYLSEILHTVRSPRCIQWFLLALGLVSIFIGLMMTAGGLFKSEVEAQSDPANSGSIIVAICGVLIFVFGVLMVAVYIQLIRRRKGCSCFSKERRLARDLHPQVGNGQYGPASENPPAVTEEETHQLMSNDHKEVDKLHPTETKKSQPSRVHRSISSVSKRGHAPLASLDELSPSLRSSFCSNNYFDYSVDSSETRTSSSMQDSIDSCDFVETTHL
nr:PREDICTED: uncharacterized protein LOC109035917 isoform X2 [Bemisia tabaci]